MVTHYERLRSEVLCGQARPAGLSAIVYHGLVHGLAVLLDVTPQQATLAVPTTVVPSMRGDREFLHLLANMVLRAHSESTHVY